MTTPTLSDKLGDFTQVQLGPDLPVPIMNGVPGLSVTLSNQDLINTVTIARRNNFSQGGSNTATIPPLGSVTVDASKTIWGLAPTGTLPLLIFPGGGNWAPSPAQVAAQINALGLAKDTSVNNPAYSPITTGNAGLLSTLSAQTNQNTAIPNNIAATGVPLLVLPQSLYNNNFTVAAGTTTLIGPFTITQPGYELLFSLWSSVAANVFLRVTMQWFDPTTGVKVDQQSWYMLAGANATTDLHAIQGTGPTVNAQLQIGFTAVNGLITIPNVLLHQNSRIYTRHDFRTFTHGNYVNGLSASGTDDMQAMVLTQQLASSVATGTHITIYSPLYAGVAYVGAHTSSNTSDATLTFNAFTDTSLTSPVQIYQQKTDGVGNINQPGVTIPRAQLQIVFSNGNAGTVGLTLGIIMKDTGA